MDTPLIISGAGHLGLIMFLLFGGVFTRAPEPEIRSAEVTVMSEEEFAALTRPETGEVEPPPMIEAEEPAAAVDPDAPEDQPPPEQPRTVDPAPRPEPQPVPEPDPEPAPDPAPEPDPEPAPEPDLPQAEESVPDAAPRVAPEPTPEPPVEAETAETPERAVLPDPAEQAERVEETAPAAPPEATTEIVTEAEEPTARAPTSSGRPRTRPERLAAAPPEPEPEPDEPPAAAPQTEGRTAAARSDAVQDAVNDTIAGLEQRLEQGMLEGAPAGPPLSQGEQEAFKLQVRRCWNVDVGSEAASVSVTIGFDMTPDNRVVSSSLEQVAVSGGSGSAQRTAYEWGRRAILRCQVEGGGYDLPVDKYPQWQHIEVTFNPRDMRVR